MSIYTLISLGLLYIFWQPYQAEVHYKNGIAHAAYKRLKYAIEELELAVNAAPWEAHYQGQLGRFYEQKYDQSSSRQEKIALVQKLETLYQRMIELDPYNPWFYNRMGTVFQKKLALYPQQSDIHFESAKRLFIKSTLVDPQNPLFHLHYASFLHQNDLVDEALPFYERAIEIDPSIHEAIFNLGDIYRFKGLYQKALDTYLKLHAKSPNIDYLNIAISSMYLELEKREEAIPFLAEAVKTDPNEQHLLTLSSLYYEFKQFSESVAAFTQLYTRYPSNRENFSFFIQALVQINELELANQWLIDYISNYPNDTLALDQYNALQKYLPND